MTLEERIAAMLQEENLDEAKKEELDLNDEESTEEEDDEVETDPKMNKKQKCDEETEEENSVDESTEEVSDEQVEETTKGKVSEQVSALLEAEGLSEDFKIQAVAIFEAAVADRVLDVKAQLDEEYENKLNEAKEELADVVDGYLSEAVVSWVSENRVPLTQSFKADLAESFIDGLRSLFVEHNVEVPEEGEDALNIALESNESLESKLSEVNSQMVSIQEELNSMKKAKIIESVKSGMTATESDRFDALVESIEFKTEEQYANQLRIVKENFAVKNTGNTSKPASINEEVQQSVSTDSTIRSYAAFLNKLK